MRWPCAQWQPMAGVSRAGVRSIANFRSRRTKEQARATVPPPCPPASPPKHSPCPLRGLRWVRGNLATLSSESYHSRVRATASWSASGPPPGSPAPRARPLRRAAAPTPPTASPLRGLQASLCQVARDTSHRICSPSAERAGANSLRGRSEATREL